MTTQSDIVGVMRYAGFQPAMIPTLTSPTDVYTAILRSERVTNAVLDSLHLMKAYGLSKRVKALKRLRKKTHVGVSMDGLVRLQYEDRDKQRAADVVNTYIRELDRFNLETKVTTARNVREFIENRLVEVSKDLDEAESALKAFKESTGVVLISEQTEASIETAAGLYGRIAELEVTLERMRQYATEISPEVLDLQTQIRALERKLAEMGYMDSDIESESRLFPKFSSAPEFEQQLTVLMRDVEIQRSVYAVLSEQYEQAKIQEMKDTPTLQVLDWARPPLEHSWPKRGTIVLSSAALALLLSALWVLYRERSGDSLPLETEGASAGIAAMLRDDLQWIGGLISGKTGGPAG
jgi:capsule polysaccharide export protein KpsE/RkpR